MDKVCFSFHIYQAPHNELSHDYFLVFIKIFEIDTLVLIAHIQSWKLKHSFIQYSLSTTISQTLWYRNALDILHLMLTDFFSIWSLSFT